MHDIIIIGAGPAGLTAALYAQRAGRNALILEKETFGGQITFSPRVENYPGCPGISGAELGDRLLSQAMDAGAQVDLAAVEGISRISGGFLIRTDAGDYEAKTVIIATGARHRRLNLDREEELTGMGVSYCAVCDGAFYENQDVAVVGGGNTALQDALFLSSLCRTVFLVHRRDAFRADAQLVKALHAHPNIKLCLNRVVSALNGEETLSGTALKDTQSGREESLPVNGLFIAVGQEPDNAPFQDLLRLDAQGYADFGEDCRTDVEGLFVAGDCRRKDVRQLTTAVADGATAALAACAYLSAQES